MFDVFGRDARHQWPQRIGKPFDGSGRDSGMAQHVWISHTLMTEPFVLSSERVPVSVEFDIGCNSNMTQCGREQDRA